MVTQLFIKEIIWNEVGNRDFICIVVLLGG